MPKFPPVVIAEDVSFDPTGTALISTNTQDAIVETSELVGGGDPEAIVSPDTLNSATVSDANGFEIVTDSNPVMSVNLDGQFVFGDGSPYASDPANALITIYPTSTNTQTVAAVAGTGIFDEYYYPGVSLSAPEITPTSTTYNTKRVYTHDGSDYNLAMYEEIKGFGTITANGPPIFYRLGTVYATTGVMYTRVQAPPDGIHTFFPQGARVGDNTLDTVTGLIRYNSNNFQGYTDLGWTTLETALIFKTTGTQTVTGTTYVAVTELTTGTLPTGTYQFIFSGGAQSSAAASGMGFRIGAGTATITPCVGQFFVPQAASGVASNFQIINLAGTTDITSASVVAQNTNYPIFGIGYFTVTVTGTVALQMRNESAAQGTLINVGSMLRIIKI